MEIVNSIALLIKRLTVIIRMLIEAGEELKIIFV
jgi:hypothetical protein